MNRPTALGRIVSGLLLVGIVATTGCGNAPKIVVGSMNSTEQVLLAEIVAQPMLQMLGQTLNAYQALQSGEISLYPEYSGSIVTEMLKEQPSPDASLIFQRARG